MFNITKTTINMALRRGIEITIENINGWPIACFWNVENDSEWLFSYRVDGDVMSWGGNVCLPQEIKEEMPATISDETKLRELVKYISNNRHLLN